MFGVFLAFALGTLLYVIVSRTTSSEPVRRNQVLGIIMAGYCVRLILQTFLREIPFFSHGIGGDNMYYEASARIVVLIWEHTGFHYVTQDQFPEIGETSLPANVFAFVFWLNGAPTRVGCTAVVALAGCLTCFNIYKLAVDFGADEAFATRILALLLFGPAFLMYTSELYKDGLVAFFVVGAVGSAFRLSRRFSVMHAVLGLAALVPLWYVRYYLVFLAVGPLLVGVAGFNSKSAARPALAALLLLAVGAFLGSYTHAFDQAAEKFNATYQLGTSRAVIEANGRLGSSVPFDDGGSAFGALHLKLAYTLLAPFPWQSGSIGFQIGKLDAFIWYYILYRAFKAGRHLFHENKQLLLMFLVFLLPTIFMYALNMANIGLTVRQRLPIVLFTGMLAALSHRREVAVSSEDEHEAEEAGELEPANAE
jgi:hypothetical protein